MKIIINIDLNRVDSYSDYYNKKMQELEKTAILLKDTLKENSKLEENSEIELGLREKIISIKEILDHLEFKYGKLIPINEIIETCKYQKIREDEVKFLLEKLKKAGNIYSPDNQNISKI